MSNNEYADFTSFNSNPVVCQRCLQSYNDGTELFFMHDNKPDGSGKRVCAGCRQYYLQKTEARQLENASRKCQSNINALQSNGRNSGRASTSVQNVQVTQDAVSRQNVRKAVAEAQRKGIISV
jgi:hypothetical protein